MRSSTHVCRSMMADGSGQSFKFSDNGEVLAYSTPDGSLKLYDSEQHALIQEYVPSSHLSATCTYLKWGPSRRKVLRSPKKKKKKTQNEQELNHDQPPGNSSDLIAMGTASGAVLIYSVAKGELHTKLEKGHAVRVNGVDWSSGGSSLYSCADDGKVVEWDILTGQATSKWRADRGPVSALCLCPGSRLLTASRVIHLWSTEDKSKITSFTGHASPVHQLLYASYLPVTTDTEDCPLGSLYFLSAAANDRVVSVWQTADKQKKKKNALMCLSLPEAAQSFSISQPEEGKALLVGVTSVAGYIHVFEHVFNGPLESPLIPKVTIQVISHCLTPSDTPRPLPVLTAKVRSKATGHQILMAYGSIAFPTCEEIPYDNSNALVCLERTDKSKETTVKTVESVSKVKTPYVPSDVTMLTPGLSVPLPPAQNDTGKKRKRKLSTAELSLAERLDASAKGASAAAGGAGDASGSLPQANNLSILLAQGLQSQDKGILTKVLSQTDVAVVEETLCHLPVTCVVPLVEELSKRAHQHAQSGHRIVIWIKALLSVHTSYLATLPQAVRSLGTLHSLLDSRVSMLGKFTKLQGKLDLMMSQISSSQGGEGPGLCDPILVHHDDSSDEHDDLMQDSQSDEESWDEHSEPMNGVRSSDEESVDGEPAEGNGEDSDVVMSEPPSDDDSD